MTAVPATATGANGAPGGEAYTASFSWWTPAAIRSLTTGPVSGITLAADTAQTDPLFTATGETNGGGDTGSVLISQYIKPGTSSSVYYNHYSWLRTMEDLFGVAGTRRARRARPHRVRRAAGSGPFGPDVFNNAPRPLDAGRVRPGQVGSGPRHYPRVRLATRE